MPNRVYLALGSNLGSPQQQAQQAIVAIQQLKQTQLLACSSFYRTAPLGPSDQPDYLNAVLLIETQLSASSLLTALQQIETDLGRVRHGLRWGARTLDLDILLFGDEIIQTETLIVPHYDMHNRPFVLLPLQEIAPQLLLPNGKSLAELIQQLPDSTPLNLWQ